MMPVIQCLEFDHSTGSKTFTASGSLRRKKAYLALALVRHGLLTLAEARPGSCALLRLEVGLEVQVKLKVLQVKRQPCLRLAAACCISESASQTCQWTVPADRIRQLPAAASDSGSEREPLPLEAWPEACGVEVAQFGRVRPRLVHAVEPGIAEFREARLELQRTLHNTPLPLTSDSEYREGARTGGATLRLHGCDTPGPTATDATEGPLRILPGSKAAPASHHPLHTNTTGEHQC